MSWLMTWLQVRELVLFQYVNGNRHAVLDSLLRRMTHLGGAAFTVITTLGLSFFAPHPFDSIGLHAFLALLFSHLPAAFMKRKYPRRRPYLVLPQATICAKPLHDASFPSGHTTAIFSVTVPFLVEMPAVGLFLLPLAAIVGLSRIYLGLHYPSAQQGPLLVQSLGCSLPLSPNING